ncbi:transcriptional regulator [uncultured Brevundimonas sp.]|uniref:winged helix-turn-helix domain-containing protein n=1 Tax=uncultured Brevundimonas sp. TaxID=213418 RepID=UPI00261DC75C|nr:transcriptional regulator [uncultured Brevundimonas sp.]
MAAAQAFAFGPFVLAPHRQLLMRDGVPLRIGGRALDLLTALVERPGELLSKSELMVAAWPNTFVDEANLKVNMGVLRRVLDDDPNGGCIATVVGRGYRFVAPVACVGDDEIAPTDWPADRHDRPTDRRPRDPASIIYAVAAVVALASSSSEISQVLQDALLQNARLRRHGFDSSKRRARPRCGGQGARSSPSRA